MKLKHMLYTASTVFITLVALNIYVSTNVTALQIESSMQKEVLEEISSNIEIVSSTSQKTLQELYSNTSELSSEIERVKVVTGSVASR